MKERNYTVTVQEVKPKRFNWKLFNVIGLIIVIVGVAVTATFLLVSKSDGMTVRALGSQQQHDIEQARPKDFKNSRLHLYSKTKTFTVKIVSINSDNPELVGIGTYSKNGGTYTLTYLDMWRTVGNDYVRAPEYNTWVDTAHKKNGLIEITSPNSRSYFFK
jgi:hypothetical protein